MGPARAGLSKANTGLLTPSNLKYVQPHLLNILVRH